MAEKVKMSLIGANGNGFALIGLFQRNAREQGWNKEEIENVVAKATDGDYDHLLRVLMENIDDSLDIDENYYE